MYKSCVRIREKTANTPISYPYSNHGPGEKHNTAYLRRDINGYTLAVREQCRATSHRLIDNTSDGDGYIRVAM